MIAALEVLFLLILLVLAILTYRWLVRSRWFANLVNSVVTTPAVTDEEVADQMGAAVRTTRRRISENKEEATKKRQSATRLRNDARRLLIP